MKKKNKGTKIEIEENKRKSLLIFFIGFVSWILNLIAFGPNYSTFDTFIFLIQKPLVINEQHSLVKQKHESFEGIQTPSLFIFSITIEKMKSIILLNNNIF